MNSTKKTKGFFITGTGTGVGKTFAARVLAEAFSKILQVSYMKPVQTGCIKKNGKISAPDFNYVMKSKVLIAGNEIIHVPYRFRPACSPHCAARMAGQTISLAKINDSFKAVAALFGRNNGCILVEGAGGVLVPLNDKESVIHLIMRLDLPVILVATAGLGTLNHTFLSICALQSCGARIAGVVMNSPEKAPVDFIYKDNRESIRSFVRPIPFLEITYKGTDAKRTEEFRDELAERYL